MALSAQKVLWPLHSVTMLKASLAFQLLIWNPAEVAQVTCQIHLTRVEEVDRRDTSHP